MEFKLSTDLIERIKDVGVDLSYEARNLEEGECVSVTIFAHKTASDFIDITIATKEKLTYHNRFYGEWKTEEIERGKQNAD